jgi:hypothetical protein
MPTMVGATMSSMRRNRSVKQAPSRTSARTPGAAGTAKEKERVFGPLFLFGSSREPDEDGVDISVAAPSRKEFKGCHEYFRAISEIMKF